MYKMECAKEEKVISFDFREPQVPSFKPSLTEELNKLSFVKLNASFKPFLLACFSFLEAGIALWFFCFYFDLTCILQLCGLLLRFCILVVKSS